MRIRTFLLLMTAALIPAAVTLADPDPVAPVQAEEHEAMENEANQADEANQASAQISPDALSLIEQLQAAYAELESLDLAGTVTADFDVAGEQLDRQAEFTATFKAPNLFRHEMTDDILLGSTGEQAYVYRPSDRLYITAEAPDERVPASELPSPIPELLQTQNPALLLAISSDAAEHIARGATEVTRLDDVQIEGRDFNALQFKSPGGDLRLLIDPQTNLIRQIMLDLKAALQAQGQPDVNTAQLTFDYTRTEPNAQVDEAQFEWSPPQGARDATAALNEARAGNAGNGPAAMGLVGQPAPDFTLENLNGEQVQLSSLKGQVVLLDFWATWCGPCIQAMPHLQELYNDLQDQDFRLFLVNLRENNNQVQNFMQAREFTMPVLMDRRGEVAGQYRVQGIPQTVLIGKDGTVQRVFIGFGPGGEKQLHEAVNAALQAE